MAQQVKVTVYQEGADQPYFESDARDFDSLRREGDKIFVVTMPNGDRVFMHVTDH